MGEGRLSNGSISEIGRAREATRSDKSSSQGVLQPLCPAAPVSVEGTGGYTWEFSKETALCPHLPCPSGL